MLLGGAVVEIVCFCHRQGRPTDMDSQSDKIADCQRHDKRRNSQQASGLPALQNAVKTVPDNKYYEVEAILDGPRKRREHLFKYCYKVRWKGYGPEADTWQPIADLANVEDMIEDYKKERAMKQREKGKKKPAEKSHGIGTRGRQGSQSQIPSSSDEYDSDDDDDDDKKYDPVYGTVKDKFWKDLELGRHQNHSQLFSGDMYSKVKGCRRAAHADAVVNIQRQQQLLSKTHLTSDQPPIFTPSEFVHSDIDSKTKSSPRLSSKSALSSARSKSPIYYPVSRVRKRSSDPFSARGYMSAKRSRRSRETKGGNMSLRGKRLSISSVTSESHGTSPVESSSLLSQMDTGSLNVSQSNPDIDEMSISSACDATNSKTEIVFDEDTVVYDKADENSQDNLSVLSNTSLVVMPEDLETRSIGEEVQVADSEMVQLDPAAHHLQDEVSSMANTDASCGVTSSCVNVGASGSGSDTNAGPSYDAGGATSGGALPGPSVINRTLSPKRSPLDAQSEASGAVERSHDEDCLWNGACNRSDCKSNRRRNMKNGQRAGGGVRIAGTDNDDTNAGGENSGTENESQTTNSYNTAIEDDNHERSGGDILPHISENTEHVHSDTGALGNQELQSKNPSSRNVKKLAADCPHTSASQSSSLMCTSYQPSYSFKGDCNSPSSQAQNSRQQASIILPTVMSTRKLGSTNIDSSKASPSSQSHSSGQTCRSLFSSYHADSSDSSFDESPSSGALLSREAVSDSFCQVDPLGRRFRVDVLSGSTINRAAAHASSSTHESSGGNTSQGIIEMRRSNVDGERPGLFSDNNSAFSFVRQDSGFVGGSGSATPGEHDMQFMLPSSTGSIHICSPGKENFGSSSVKSSGSTSAGGYNRLQIPMIADGQNTHPDPSSNLQSLSSQPRIFSEPLESRAARKRGSEPCQPLEKIPSPNSRDSDLDRRISTLTCDELEDFVEQGEERCSQKDVAFVSNADLLQAVNLSKAEVVKHAIRQFRLTEHKLDFEQSDNTGLTLLMRAVQKGTLAIVEMLLEHGVNVNAQQTNGTTALMIAAEQNGMSLVALLLKHGSNSSLYTIHTDKTETALMKAIKRQHQEVVNLMLRVGVNIAAPTCTSISALELAIERRNPHIERIIRYHCQRLDQAFQSRVLATLEGTAELVEPLFPMQCFPLRESHQFVVKFNSNIHPVVPGEGFLLFIAHTKITDKGVRCRFHGGCPIGSVTLNGIVQSALTKEVNFVTSCHPIIPGCNTLIIHKQADYTSKETLLPATSSSYQIWVLHGASAPVEVQVNEEAKLVVQAFRARLLPC